MTKISIVESVSVWIEIIKRKLLEYIRFDSKVAALFLFFAYSIIQYILIIVNRRYDALSYAGKSFRHVNIEWTRKCATRMLVKTMEIDGKVATGNKLLMNVGVKAQVADRLKKSLKNEKRPFEKRLIILSPPKNREKGVLLVKFTDYFIYLPVIFDLDKLGSDYILVLEPSGTGYFDEYILCLMGRNIVAIIQAAEPVDYDFIKSLDCNLYPIDLGANCWVDDRVFFPISNEKKEYDIIMVSIWADFKRHYHLFEALSKSTRKNEIKIALIGVPYPRSINFMKKLADYYGVRDRITFYENITQSDINELYNKSKIYTLLSKKEGFNKALIEAMHADVPGFILSGFNYGYHYDYINEATGGYVNPSELHQFIDNIDKIIQTSNFSPRNWVTEHMSVKISTDKLIKRITELEKELNIRVNKELELKVNNPNCDYMDSSAWHRYTEDYKNLQSYLK